MSTYNADLSFCCIFGKVLQNPLCLGQKSVVLAYGSLLGPALTGEEGFEPPANGLKARPFLAWLTYSPIDVFIYFDSEGIYMKTCELCKSQFKTRIKIDGKLRNLQSRKFCLICSPFGYHNTSKIGPRLVNGTFVRYEIYRKTLPSRQEYLNEYNRKHKHKSRNRSRHLRKLAILKLGSKCSLCEFSDYRALHLDHINSDGKIERKQYRQSMYRSIVDGNRTDIQLICANCKKK